MKINPKQSVEVSQIPIETNNKAKRPTYFELKNYPHKGIFQYLAFMLIRPPRFVYNPEILKPNKRNSARFTAETHSIGFELTIYKQVEMRYVLLYLHGNGSSRFEGNLFLHSLPDKVGLACFDFNGCGNRQQVEYITLGQNESKDVDTAAVYLKQLGYIVVGWGRSMGAVSLLKSSQCDIMVSDSAYSNLTDLCRQTSEHFLPKVCCCVFPIVFPCIFECVKCAVEEKSGLHIQDMNIIKQMEKISQERIKKSICFIHGNQDSLIPCSHAQRLCDAFNGRKQVITFQGTHNSVRPDDTIEKCFQFIDDCLSNLEEPRSVLPENLKLKKMIELEDMHRNLSKQHQSQKNKSKYLIPRRSKDKGKDYIHVHSSYSNGHSQKQSQVFPMPPDEEYMQTGIKIEASLQDSVIGSKKPFTIPSGKKDSDFQMALTHEESPQGKTRQQIISQRIIKKR